MNAYRVRIGGVQRLTLSDFPGHPACIIFFAGCNFRCGYCHNPELVLPEQIQSTVPLSPDAVLRFLKDRQGLLSGVVLSGGEATLQHDLLPFIREVHTMGYAIKLDTNGSHPDVVAACMAEHLLSYIALDIKMPFAHYADVAGIPNAAPAIQRTLSLLIGGGVAYECRTTLIPGIHTTKMFHALVADLCGISRYALQGFRPSPKGCLASHYNTLPPFPPARMQRYAAYARAHLPDVITR